MKANVIIAAHHRDGDIDELDSMSNCHVTELRACKEECECVCGDGDEALGMSTLCPQPGLALSPAAAAAAGVEHFA